MPFWIVILKYRLSMQTLINLIVIPMILLYTSTGISTRTLVVYSKIIVRALLEVSLLALMMSLARISHSSRCLALWPTKTTRTSKTYPRANPSQQSLKCPKSTEARPDHPQSNSTEEPGPLANYTHEVAHQQLQARSMSSMEQMSRLMLLQLEGTRQA